MDQLKRSQPAMDRTYVELHNGRRYSPLYFAFYEPNKLCTMSDYKEIRLKDQDLHISNNELIITVDIEEVINQFTLDEIIDNIYNLEKLYEILKKEFDGL
jgi:hypothetical protein